MDAQKARDRWNAELTGRYDGRERQQMWRHLRRAGRPSGTADLDGIIDRLKRREPFDYILGTSEFYGLEFRVGPGVLIPRPETEELVGWVLDSGSAASAKTVLDIGTGSGCVAVSLAVHRPAWRITAIDASADALAIARANALQQDTPVDFLEMDILESAPSGPYDLIVSNPPYIADGERSLMSPGTLQYEPAEALFTGSDDPLRFYRRIAELGREILSADAAIYFELNEFHADAAAALLRNTGYGTEVRTDLQGKPRMMRARR